MPGIFYVAESDRNDAERGASRGLYAELITCRLEAALEEVRGEAAPHTFLGPATYVSHQCERPMSITWLLDHPRPAELFEEMKVAAG